jgi:tetratricopeptide (TPR) repeat protein
MQDAVQKQPHHIQSLVGAAYLADKLGRVDDAERWFGSVVSQFPLHTGARFRLAELAEDRGATDDAVKHYEAVAAHEPRNPDPLLRAANAAWNGQQMAVAHRLLKAVLEIDPGHTGALDALATLNERRTDL